MNKYRIKDISVINPHFDRTKFSPDSLVSFIPMSAISDINYRIEGEVESVFTKYSKGYTSFEKGDILLAKITPCFENGKIAIADISHQAGFGSTEFYVIRTDPKSVLTKYLFYILRSEAFLTLGKENMTGSAGQKRLRRDFLENFQVSLPSLENQRRIIEILDKADFLSKKRKQAITFLDEYLNSVFLEMFGNPVENEKRWDVKRLKNISIKILSGNTPKGGTQVYVNKGVLFLRSQNVWRNRLDLDKVAFISEETHNKMRNSSLEHKDLIMTKTGRINTENSSLGRAAIYLGENNRANINGHVYLIRLKKDTVHEFVLFILTTNEYREYIRRICVGGIDKRQINKVHLEEFPIISPPNELQNKFSEILYKTDFIKQKMLLQSQQLDTQFQALMQKSFHI